MRTRVKICGITRLEDAQAAIMHGADALGFVFYAPSPRNISIEQAKYIVDRLPPYISKVGLFVNASRNQIEQVLSQVRLDTLQYHGEETVADCEQINLPYYKAIRVKSDTNLIQYATTYHSANALLLDTYSDAAVGGTGQVFDWSIIPSEIAKPVILAGGLSQANVGQAITQVKPYAVDVSGGVELSKGIKDDAKIAAFMHIVNQYSI